MTPVIAREIATRLAEARKTGMAGSILWLQCNVVDHLSDTLTWEMIEAELRDILAKERCREATDAGH